MLAEPEVGGRGEQLPAGPRNRDSETSYLKAANRGQPVPHSEEEKDFRTS